MPASVIAEALKRGETIENARKRLRSMPHVERHYRGIGIPALAAATQAIKSRRIEQAGGDAPSTFGPVESH